VTPLQYERVCFDPNDPEDCVWVPQQGTAINDDGNPILGSATQDGPQEMDKLCNPDDPNECILVPKRQRPDPEYRLQDEDEDGPIEFAEMCNPEDPTDCVWVPMPGEGESARDGDNSDPLNPPHFLGWDTEHGGQEN